MRHTPRTPPNRRLGIDLGGSKIEAAMVAADGAIAARRRVATPAGYEAALRAIRELVAAMEAEEAAPLTVGVGHPGSLSPATGLMRNANSTWLNGKPLHRDLEAALGRPVRLANDADCFALSEAVDGAGASARIVFGVILGTGVGGGVAIDQTPLSGAQGIAGEWGHNPLPWPSEAERAVPPCWCGKTGCLETWLSGPGFAEAFARETGRALDAAAIAKASDAGDAEAQAALEAYADRLARGLATVVNVIDADVVVLGGGVSNIAALPAMAEERLAAYVFSDHVATRIARNRHGDSSGVRGAAWLWPAEAAA